MFSKVKQWGQRQKTEAAIFPFWEGSKNKVNPGDLFPNEWKKSFKDPIELGDFKGSVGETVPVYVSGQPESRGVLWGWGKEKESDEETMRRAAHQLALLCQKNKWNKITLYLPDLSPAFASAIAEGLLLTNYTFLEYKSEKKDEQILLQKVACFGLKQKSFQAMNEAEVVSRSVYLVRDLVNRNANQVTPQALAKVAQGFTKEFPSIKCSILTKKQIEKEKMGLFLAVAQASPVDPVFITLKYQGKPNSKDTIAIIGKGVTYDTGGLHVKPYGGMEKMKCDMAGSATALGVIKAAAELKLPCNLAVVIAATENSVDSTSYKPGDVFTAYNGKTVEIGNTDAEGRLTLADALAYTVKKIKPKQMISIATLTGAVVVALGNETIGMISNNSTLAKKIEVSGEATYERAWQLPLFKEYKDQLKSDFADLNNIGGRAAGTIVAASFLEEFVDKTPWAHLDIAGMAYLPQARRYHPKNASGIGVRLLINFLKQACHESS